MGDLGSQVNRHLLAKIVMNEHLIKFALYHQTIALSSYLLSSLADQCQRDKFERMRLEVAS